MKHLQFYMICIASTFLFLCACGQEKSFDYDEIRGEWVLIHAERNGIETTTFERAIFRFSEDSVFTTNIPSLENLGKINITGNEIQVEGNKISNTKLNLIDSTGILKVFSDIEGFRFEFTLERK